MNYFENIVSKQILEIRNFFFKITDLIDLEKKWCEKDFKIIEIKKSFLRSMLRYSNPTQELLINITNYLNKRNFFSNINWYTKLYPMIHLSQDKSEAIGGYHFDQGDDNETFTCWIPITDYLYDALSISKYDNFFTKLMAKPIIKLNLAKTIAFDLKVKAGNFYIWSGSRIHAGNLNTSEFISAAFQMKFTKKPALFEESYDFKSTNKHRKSSINENENNDFIIKRFQNYNYFVSELLDNNNESNADKFQFIKNKINKYNFYNSPDISFALSVLSQRLRSMKKNVYNYDSKDLNLDIASILTGSENFIALKRLKNEFQNDNYLEKKLIENDEKKLLPLNSYQWKTIMNTTKTYLN